MSVLICGSFAYDTIMVFQDRFKNHILPDQVHILNVCFVVPEMRREFGGCAGNIAYTLGLLDGDPLPMGTVGDDFDPYAEWMDRHGIDRTHVTPVFGTYTAQAYITTDLDDNQITAFHPGAMNEAHRNRADSVDGVEIGILAPDGRQAMIEHARQFADRGIQFVFDPGQGLPMFEKPELEEFIDAATYITLNDYESRLLQERTGRSLENIAAAVQALVVTRGGEGSRIHADGQVLEVPAVPPGTIADPTGCGDAYRAGLLFGLSRGLDWETTGRIASLAGSIKIETHGTQNHSFTPQEFARRYEDNFGVPLNP
ncbi:MAG: carbohydrate kinase family protein [Gammaproteobacteria bacterium]|nr:carbohydrate kinase family protein [Gammaproteobacteria bacterium]